MTNRAAQRTNITLPEDTLQLLDRVAPKGNRSSLIKKAVRFYVDTHVRAELRRRLKEGALKRAEEEREIVAEWYPIDAEVWPA